MHNLYFFIANYSLIFVSSKGNKYLLGIKQSEETKLKRSLKMKGRVSPMKGRIHSDETKMKMKESQKARRKQEAA